MITASNVAPTGESVKEPTVTHMGLSHDGKWLATVDEWTPHDRDLETMYVSSDSKNLKGRATETSLRLWLWNEDANTFEQVTRIDEPHKPGPGSVLGMSFNPAKLELATIGADAAVQIWSPKSRHRNGVSVRNSANEQLYTWSHTRTIHSEQDASTDEAAPHAALAYAEDGSVIAASWSFDVNTSAQSSPDSSPSSPRFTHLIDPSTGKIVFSQPSLLSAGPANLLFHTRYLLCLSSSLQIFDTITCQSLTSPINFDPLYVSPQSQAPIFLARNKFDGTFAVGVGKSEWPRTSKVMVFSFENENELIKLAGEGSGAEGRGHGGVDVKIVYQGSFTGMVKGLLALTTGPGYFLIDERNQTRVLRQTGGGAGVGRLALTHGLRKPKIETEEVMRSLDSIFGRGSRPGMLASTDGASAGAIEGAPVVRGLLTSPPEDESQGANGGGLESVLRFTTSAIAPSPAELFRRVVGVLGRAVGAK
jgi:NET1-associated nuclear protein 1 (U3 small nucleolar RNA-associated protein 17)